MVHKEIFTVIRISAAGTCISLHTVNPKNIDGRGLSAWNSELLRSNVLLRYCHCLLPKVSITLLQRELQFLDIYMYIIEKLFLR